LVQRRLILPDPSGIPENIRLGCSHPQSLVKEWVAQPPTLQINTPYTRAFVLTHHSCQSPTMVRDAPHAPVQTWSGDILFTRADNGSMQPTTKAAVVVWLLVFVLFIVSLRFIVTCNYPWHRRTTITESPQDIHSMRHASTQSDSTLVPLEVYSNHSVLPLPNTSSQSLQRPDAAYLPTRTRSRY